MANTEFMQQKYSVDELIAHYLEEIRSLRSYVKSPSDENKLQTYFQAANTFHRVSVKEMAQFALSFGRSQSGKSAQMRQALPTLLSNRVTQPSEIDVAYARLLLAYTVSFKAHRGNIKEWLLSFVLSSRFSPLTSVFEREINNVIQNTRSNIANFESRI